MSEIALKWGFFGAGKCTADFVTALQLLPLESHKAVGIASKDFSKAATFAKDFEIPKWFGKYEELAKDPEINVIYVGTVNSEHFPLVKLAIEEGKHVLCEKPLCVNYKQVKEVTDLAKSKSVFLMEGFWTNFFPAMVKLEEKLKTNCIGEVVHMTLELGNTFSQVDRFRRKDLGGGALLNHGIYGIMLACKFFGQPDGISAQGHLSPEGVDESTVVNLSYKDTSQMATLIVSSRARMPGELRLIGTAGTMMLRYPFWAPQELITPDGSYQFPLPKSRDGTKFNYIFGAGFTYEAEEVRKCISQGLLESPSMPLSLSLAAIQVADEVRNQIGVIFPQD